MDMFNPLTRLFQQSSYDTWAASRDEHRIQLNDFYLQCLRIFHEEGVELMVGTDAGVMVTLPGSSVAREL